MAYLSQDTSTNKRLCRQALRVDIKGLRRQTLLQTTTVVERRTTLLKRFKRFRELQRVHMPGFDPAQHESNPAPINVEDFVLHMPSELTKARVRRFCPNGLADLEDRIRFAQATDALESLRHHLRTRSFANQFKIANVTGQIQNTRAREAQGRIDDKVRAAADEYRRARAALTKLRGPGTWDTSLRALNKADVRALNERELTQQEEDAANRVHKANGVVTELDMEHERRVQKVVSVGEGLRGPSWIWFTGVNIEGLNDPLTRKGTMLRLFSTFYVLTSHFSPPRRMGEG